MLFYFSATGNTRWAAYQIARALDEQLIDVADALYPKLRNTSDGQSNHSSAADHFGKPSVSDNSPLTYRLQPGETIGFCFPVHGWRPAPIMRHFISRMQLLDENGQALTVRSQMPLAGLRESPGGHYCWALTTAGDDIGETMERLQKCLRIRGLQASSLFSLIMPESYVGLPFMDVDNAEKEWAKRRTAESALEEDILPVLKRREPGVVKTYKGHWPRINSRLIGEAFERWLVSDKPFRVDKNLCISCGTCANICPVNDIQGGQHQQPVWLHTGRCLSCFACYHHCPVKAISYGSRTKGKGQYYLS